MLKKHPLVLMILDGWGVREDAQYNAIAAAHTPQWDAWWQTRPHIVLEASGSAVGLPEGQMGNSEVGHMHIGAGRVILQDFTRINQAIEQGTFSVNPVFLQAIQNAKQSGHCLHVMGLLSEGGVHSHENHLWAFLHLCHQHQFSNIAVHCWLDGRDTPPKSAATSLKKLEACLQENPGARIASITGRFFAMDRDLRWERVASVYRLLVNNESPDSFVSAEAALAHYYQNNITDEFIPPTRIDQGHPIQSGDSVFCFNYRADRVRQLTTAFIDNTFDHFERVNPPKIADFVTMTTYSKTLKTNSAFPPSLLQKTLGEVIAEHGMTQLRIAETEKYAHVTFFLNGGREATFTHEHRLLIPSPHVKTYDLKPEMSAPELTLALIDAIKSQTFDLIICNYANADMLGHTGNFDACVQAIEALDRAMQDTWNAIDRVGGQLLITADHGNAECLFNPENHQAHTAHTTEPVPFVYVGGLNVQFNQPRGSLIDVAPTVLKLLGITPPTEMTGRCLLDNVA